MPATSLIQLVAACVGIIGSLFFAIGVVRQSVEAMGRLSETNFGSNPHMPTALATQKADYLFGGGLIVVAFVLQLASFFVPANAEALSTTQARWAPWGALVLTILLFFVLRVQATRVASHFQVQVEARHKNRRSQTKPFAAADGPPGARLNAPLLYSRKTLYAPWRKRCKVSSRASQA
jgi:hypothetical protein